MPNANAEKNSGQPDKQTNKQTNIQTDRQTDRHLDRQTDIPDKGSIKDAPIFTLNLRTEMYSSIYICCELDLEQIQHDVD